MRQWDIIGIQAQTDQQSWPNVKSESKEEIVWNLITKTYQNQKWKHMPKKKDM